MDWNTYLDARQRQFYEMIATEQVKLYALRESVRDVCFIYEIRCRMRDICGDESMTTKYTVRAIAEMLEQDLIEITGGEKTGIKVSIQSGPMQLDELFRTNTNEWSFCTVSPTDKGREWVSRYLSLLNELNLEWGSERSGT